MGALHDNDSVVPVLTSNPTASQANSEPHSIGTLTEGPQVEDGLRFVTLDSVRSTGRRRSVKSTNSHLSRTDSIRSTRRRSVKSNKSNKSTNSHTSIRVIGALPLGCLSVANPGSESLTSPEIKEMGEDLPGMAEPGMPSLEEPVAQRKPDPSKKEGDIFLILDLPLGLTVGCDANVINTGRESSFRGIRDLSKGTHFVWVHEPNNVSRTGYWFVTDGKNKVHIKQWNSYNEILDEAASQFEVIDIEKNIDALYPSLVPCGNQKAASSADTDSASLWWQLTWAIDEKVLSRMTGRTDAGEWRIETSDNEKGESHFSQTTELFKANAGSDLDFLFSHSDIDLAKLNLGRRGDPSPTSSTLSRLSSTKSTSTVSTVSSTASNATNGLDMTVDILRTLDTPGRGISEKDMIGELQFTFISGLHLSNIACIDQWWHLILKIFLRAHSLILSRPSLCRAFIETFYAQMKYHKKYFTSDPDNSSDGTEMITQAGHGETSGDGDGSTDMFESKPRNKNRLREALKVYKQRLDEALLTLEEDQITVDQTHSRSVFTVLELGFWRLGWDPKSGGSVTSGHFKENSVRGSSNGSNQDDDDDDMPVIVELDENGKEVGLVSFD